MAEDRRFDSRVPLAVALGATGLSGMVAQIVLLRELLVTFLGNELSVGVILGNWLLLEALGSLLGRGVERSRDRVSLFVLVVVLFCATLPASLYLSRILRPLLGTGSGEGVGFLYMLVASLPVLLPVALTHGALFTMGARIYSSWGRGAAAGTVYFIEVAGTAVGGILFTYLFLPRLNAFQVVFVVMLLNLAFCLILLPLRSRPPRAPAALPAVLIAALAAGAGLLGLVSRLQESSLRRQWGELDVVFYKNSPYGNVTVTRLEEQRDFFADGIPLISLPNPNPAAVEDFVHFPLLYHPDPGRVLLISGAAGGVLAEVAKHGVGEVDYVELDPLLFEALEQQAPAGVLQELHRPGLQLHPQDGRRFLAASDGGYDLILVGLGSPGDLQVNRFFSREFFDLARSRLNPDGILFFTLPGSLTYLSDELAGLNACILKTLREAFRHTGLIAGEENLFLASQGVDFAVLGTEVLKNRLSQRGLSTSLFTPAYIDYRLREGPRRWLYQSLEAARTRTNRDFRPVGVYYSLGLWNAGFAPYLRKVFLLFGRLTLPAALAFCLFSALLCLLLARLLHHGFPKVVLPFAVVSTGCCGMLFDLVVVFCFQVLFGNVYQRIGLLVTCFMAGSGLGSLAVTLSPRPQRGPLHRLLLVEAALVLTCLLLPLLLTSLLSRDPGAAEIPFYAAALMAGAVTGAEFPLAVLQSQASGRDFSSSVAMTNAADLLGGWWAGLLGGVVLLPVLGIWQTCLMLAALKACSLALLLLHGRAGGKPGQCLL